MVKTVHCDMNTELRKLARNDFEKDLFKLMNNSVFGESYGKYKKTQRYKFSNNR